MFRSGTKLNPYKLWNNKKFNVKYFRVFGSSCYNLRDRENLYNFDSEGDKEIFIGYLSHNKVHRVYNLQTQTILESINMVVDDNLKESIKKDHDNIIEITKETLS